MVAYGVQYTCKAYGPLLKISPSPKHMDVYGKNLKKFHAFKSYNHIQKPGEGNIQKKSTLNHCEAGPRDPACLQDI
jgi:hypothetical protein